MKQRITLYATDSVLRSLEVEAESLEEAIEIGYSTSLNDWDIESDLYDFSIIKAVNHTLGKETDL